jgi:hypothetical protein
MLVDRIFAENVNAWIAFQACDFTLSRISRPLPYAESVLKTKYTPDEYNDACSVFVCLEPNQSAGHLCTKNTFLETVNDSDSREALSLLRKVSSEPLLRSGQFCIWDDSDEAPLRAPELQQYQQYKCLSGGSSNSSKQSEDWNEEDQQRRQPMHQPEPSSSPKLQNKLTLHDQPLLVSGGQGKSIGSVLHPDHCTPCSFFCYSLTGCNRGKECEYCHEDHPKANTRRGKKNRKANRNAANADREFGEAAEVPPEPWGVVPPDMHDVDRGLEEEGKEQRGQNWSQNQDVDISTAADVASPMHPAPTPNPLVPLLTALEFLAPLPTPAVVTPMQATLAHDAVTDSWHQEEYHIANADPHVAFPCAVKLSLWYHESTISLEVGTRKHIIPFLTCNAELKGKELEPLNFSVQPELPQGLHLDSESGVIKGVTTRPTTTSGYSRHTVVAANSALCTSTTIDILVRPSARF